MDTNYIFVANYYAFPVYIGFFGQIRYLNIRHERTRTSSPLMLKCSERCRETQEREQAHTGWCPVIQPQKFPRYLVITELIYLLISASMVSMMFRRLIWIHFFITFWLFVCITSFYLSLPVILTSHFSNITYFRQQQQQNKPMKYYEILPTHTETPRNTTHKIAIYTLNLSTTFWHCKKKSHYFWTGVYKWAPVSCSGMAAFHLAACVCTCSSDKELIRPVCSLMRSINSFHNRLMLHH